MIWVGMSRLAKYWHQMAEAKTSMPASLSGLPCSAVSTGASSAVDAHQHVGRLQEDGAPRRLVGLPVAGRLGRGVEGGIELLAGALGRLGEDLAGGGVADAERVLGRSGLPGDGHDEIGHGTPRLLRAGGGPHRDRTSAHQSSHLRRRRSTGTGPRPGGLSQRRAAR